jgi:hypothetical protein
MYERLERYEDAIKYCEIAINKGLSDGTKSGFYGRKNRLLKKYISK